MSAEFARQGLVAAAITVRMIDITGRDYELDEWPAGGLR